MSEITPATAQLKTAISDANTSSNRGQAAAQLTPAAPTPAIAAPSDTVQISAAAQAAAGPPAGTPLTDSEAQDTATTLRQQIGLYGLSASARQNASVLALLRPSR
jgi:hypothetical protein